MAVAAPATAVAAPATGSLTVSYDLFILKANSHFFEQSEPYVRTQSGGRVTFGRIYVRNIGEQPAPATRVGFRWRQLRDDGTSLRVGPVVATVRVGAIPLADQRHTDRPVRVPLPKKNGRYRIQVCANTPEIEKPESPRGNNCSDPRRRVIIRREFGTPDPGTSVLLESSPPSGQFGPVLAGTQSSPINFAIRNRGRGSTGPGTATIGGRDPAMFRVDSNGCSGGLSGTSSCRLSAVYAPPQAASGSYEAVLQVAFSGGAVINIPLSGSS
jgi:hypothetical protein